jgi:hypothetical protein
MMIEDPTVNRMADALVLFEQTCKHPMLIKKNFVLFLNKKDLYEKKVHNVSISTYFPDYTGIKVWF